MSEICWQGEQLCQTEVDHNRAILVLVPMCAPLHMSAVEQSQSVRAELMPNLPVFRVSMSVTCHKIQLLKTIWGPLLLSCPCLCLLSFSIEMCSSSPHCPFSWSTTSLPWHRHQVITCTMIVPCRDGHMNRSFEKMVWGWCRICSLQWVMQWLASSVLSSY